MSHSETFEELKWKKFDVLNNDGAVALVDKMGTDADIIQAARVSFGRDSREELQAVLSFGDRNLLRYLMRNRHSTPFEMVELKFFVRCPMDVWRQWIRHRTASVNEYSTRYKPAIDARLTTDPGEWRLQAQNRKQGSDGTLTEWPENYTAHGGPKEMSPCVAQDNRIVRDMDELPAFTAPTPGDYLSAVEKDLHEKVQEVYQERLKFGVAAEQARKDLTLSTFTESYWKCNLHNLLHFLGLRMDSHAQQEIREYATIIGEQIVAPLFPETWKAFCDYRLNAMYLTALDVQVLKEVIGELAQHGFVDYSPGAGIWPEEWRSRDNCRERDECINKLALLGAYTK